MELTNTSIAQALEIAASIPTPAPRVPTAKRPRLSPEERAARDEARTQERAAKKVAREETRAAKKAAKEEATKNKVTHLAKVKKAAEGLPELTDELRDELTMLTNEYDTGALTALVAHINYAIRVASTVSANQAELTEGQLVRIISGAAKFLGTLGTVTKASRIRCRVRPVGSEHDVYLLKSDVTPVEDAEVGSIEPESNEDVAQAV